MGLFCSTEVNESIQDIILLPVLHMELRQSYLNLKGMEFRQKSS